MYVLYLLTHTITNRTLVLGNTDWLSNDTSQTGEGDTTTSKKTVTSRVALTLEQKQMQVTRV